MRNPFTAAALGAALALSLAMPASAADPQPDKEIAAAAQHAGFAAGSSDIAGIHTHLHHAVNCLVGPEGEGFAPKELRPNDKRCSVSSSATTDGDGAVTRAAADRCTATCSRTALRRSSRRCSTR